VPFQRTRTQMMGDRTTKATVKFAVQMISCIAILSCSQRSRNLIVHPIQLPSKQIMLVQTKMDIKVVIPWFIVWSSNRASPQ
jgi:hypothetical protein